MKKFLAIALVFLLPGIMVAQQETLKKLFIRVGGEIEFGTGGVLKLGGYSVTGIANDLTDSSTVKLITQAAVKKFVKDSISAHRTDINNLQTLTGRPDGSTHFGTFTGSTIADNQSIKTAVQSLETAVEAAAKISSGYEFSDTQDNTLMFQTGHGSVRNRAVINDPYLVEANGLNAPLETQSIITGVTSWAMDTLATRRRVFNDVSYTLLQPSVFFREGATIRIVFENTHASNTITITPDTGWVNGDYSQLAAFTLAPNMGRAMVFSVIQKQNSVKKMALVGGGANSVKTTSDNGSTYSPAGSPSSTDVVLDTRRGAFSQNSANVTPPNGNLAVQKYSQTGTTLSSWDVTAYNRASLTVNTGGNVTFDAVSNLSSANIGDKYMLEVYETNSSNHFANWNANFRESDGSTSLLTDSIRSGQTYFFEFVVKNIGGTKYLCANDFQLGSTVAKNQIAVGNGSGITGTSNFTWDGSIFAESKLSSYPTFALGRGSSSTLMQYKQKFGLITFNGWLNDGTLRYDDPAQIYAVYASPGNNTESSSIVLRNAEVSGAGHNLVWDYKGRLGVNSEWESSFLTSDSIRARLHVFDYDAANIPSMMFTNVVGGDTTLFLQQGKLSIGSNTKGNGALNVNGSVMVGATYAESSLGGNGLSVEGNVGVGTTTNTSGYKLDVVGKIRSSSDIETGTATITYQGNRIAYWNPSLQNTQIGQLTASLSPTGTANQLFGYQVGSNITSGGSNVGLGYSLFQGLTTGSNNFAFGVSSGANSTTRNNTFCLGRNAVPTANNQFVIGSANYLYSDFYLGYGVTTDQGLFGTNLHGASITGSADASAVNGLFSINGARGTGTGVGGDIRFQVAPAAGSTSSTTNSLSEAMRIKQDKKIGVGTTAPDQLFDINLGTAGAFQLTYNDANGSAATYATQTLSSTGVLTFNATGSAAGFTFSDDVTVPTEVYDATGWNGDLTVPTKDAVRDKLESLGLSGTPWLLGGQNTAANANIGTNDAFRFGITTNGTARLYFGTTGRMYAGTLTDVILTPSDSLKLSGNTIDIDGSTKFANRIQGKRGSDVASANDITLGAGNLFYVTGTTDITAITTSGWQSGSEIVLMFQGSVTVKNNTAGGGGTAPMLLSSSVDFAATANDILKLIYDGSNWIETGRSAN